MRVTLLSFVVLNHRLIIIRFTAQTFALDPALGGAIGRTGGGRVGPRFSFILTWSD